MKFKILLASIFAIFLVSCNDKGSEVGILVKNVRSYYFYSGADSMDYTEQLSLISFYNSTYDTIYYRYNQVDVETGDAREITKVQYNNLFNSYGADSMKYWSDGITSVHQILDNGTYKSIAPSEALYEQYNVPLTVR